MPPSDKSLPWIATFHASLHSDLNKLVNSPLGADITFLVGKDEVVRHGHSAILSVRCPYFEMALQPECWKESSDKQFKKPNIEPEIFDLVLHYLYTGEITLTMDTLTQLVDAAVELRIGELLYACVEYIRQQLSHETIWKMLVLADRHRLKHLWSICIAYFEMHVDELLDLDNGCSNNKEHDTDTNTNNNKSSSSHKNYNSLAAVDVDLLVDILSRDTLDMDELKIWTTVVRVALCKSGLDHHLYPFARFPKWPGCISVNLVSDEGDEHEYMGDGQEERLDSTVINSSNNNSNKKESKGIQEGNNEVISHSNNSIKPNSKAASKDVVIRMHKSRFKSLREAIEPLLPAVRFANIHIHDFARLIKGTGLLPLDLCLQVYEYHSLPAQISCTHRLAPPRGQLSTILPLEHWQQLAAWISETECGSPSSSDDVQSTPKLKRLFLASKHGFDAFTFHALCDGRGPTVTVALTDNGDVVGGYNARSWYTREYEYSESENNFIFHLEHRTLAMHVYFVEVGHERWAACNHVDFGPVFGQGHDLHITGNGKSSGAFPHTYSGAKTWTLGRPFNVIDYEVFQVSMS